VGSLHCFSVLSLVVQFDDAASALILRIDDASIKRPGIDMQADSSLVKFTRIVDAMDRFIWIHGAGLARIHFDCVRGLQFTCARVQIL